MSNKVKKENFNSVNENVQAPAKLFPSVVKDGEVDFDALKEEFGDETVRQSLAYLKEAIK
ncbi:MAG: hypothetical protein E7381_03145 [Clostridiales bacterium]|nr:hypothetical protein [Clostridiales bacterium]